MNLFFCSEAVLVKDKIQVAFHAGMEIESLGNEGGIV